MQLLILLLIKSFYKGHYRKTDQSETKKATLQVQKGWPLEHFFFLNLLRTTSVCLDHRDECLYRRIMNQPTNVPNKTGGHAKIIRIKFINNILTAVG